MPRVAPKNNNLAYSPKVSDRKLEMSLNSLSGAGSLVICRSSLGNHVYKYEIQDEAGLILYEAIDVSQNFPKAAVSMVMASKQGEYICELKSPSQLRGKSLQIERRYRSLGEISSHSNSLLRVDLPGGLPYLIVSKWIKKSLQTRLQPKVFYVFGGDAETSNSTLAVISQRQNQDFNWRLNFYDKQLNSHEKLLLISSVIMLATPSDTSRKWKKLLQYSTTCVSPSS